MKTTNKISMGCSVWGTDYNQISQSGGLLSIGNLCPTVLEVGKYWDPNAIAGRRADIDTSADCFLGGNHHRMGRNLVSFGLESHQPKYDGSTPNLIVPWRPPLLIPSQREPGFNTVTLGSIKHLVHTVSMLSCLVSCTPVKGGNFPDTPWMFQRY